MFPAPSAASETPSFQVLVRQFENVAFNTEFGGQHRRGRIIRWSSPIRARLKGINAEQFRQEVEQQFALLARLTGLRFEIEGGWNPLSAEPNMDIVFVAPDGSSTINADAACVTRIYDRNYVIERAEIVIMSHIPDLRRHCIVEEITQALGLANDSELIGDSIFNDGSRGSGLSFWDEVLVSTLYDRRLAPGMTRRQALPWIEVIINDHLSRAGLK